MPWVNDDAPNASRNVVKDSQARNMSTVVVDDTDQISYTENGVVELEFATDMPLCPNDALLLLREYWDVVEYGRVIEWAVG